MGALVPGWTGEVQRELAVAARSSRNSTCSHECLVVLDLSNAFDAVDRIGLELTPSKCEVAPAAREHQLSSEAPPDFGRRAGGNVMLFGAAVGAESFCASRALARERRAADLPAQVQDAWSTAGAQLSILSGGLGLRGAALHAPAACVSRARPCRCLCERVGPGFGIMLTGATSRRRAQPRWGGRLEAASLNLPEGAVKQKDLSALIDVALRAALRGDGSGGTFAPRPPLHGLACGHLAAACSGCFRQGFRLRMDFLERSAVDGGAVFPAYEHFKRSLNDAETFGALFFAVGDVGADVQQADGVAHFMFLERVLGVAKPALNFDGGEARLLPAWRRGARIAVGRLSKLRNSETHLDVEFFGKWREAFMEDKGASGSTIGENEFDGAGMSIAMKNDLVSEPLTVGAAQRRIDEATSVIVDPEAEQAEANAARLAVCEMALDAGAAPPQHLPCAEAVTVAGSAVGFGTPPDKGLPLAAWVGFLAIQAGRRLARALLVAAAAGAYLFAGNCFSLQLARGTSRRQPQVLRRGTKWDVYGSMLRQGVKHISYVSQPRDDKVRVLVSGFTHETTEETRSSSTSRTWGPSSSRRRRSRPASWSSPPAWMPATWCSRRTGASGSKPLEVRFDNRVGAGGKDHVTLGVPAKSVRVLVEGFSGSVTKEDLLDIYTYFSRVGSIHQVRFLDISVCLLYYSTQEEADEAVRLFDKSIITGDVTGVDVRLAPKGGPDGMLDRATAAIKRRREESEFERPEEFKDMSDKEYANYVRAKNARTVHVHGPAEGFDEGTTADIVEEHFSTAGTPTLVFRSARNRFIVQYSTPEEAAAAIAQCDCTVLDGNSDIIRCKLYGAEDFPVIGSMSVRRMPARQEREAQDQLGSAPGH
ncbi:unnamed protein product [Prorocentrum cordatum]|uniref:RRM domain-containing protein n=1 Tax=Prorocentrum cordatum TaxID=2364126 RepID=A0ABN9VCN1_9DINO|nr:unnamed protein product [Polarella glacialis]